MWSLGQQEQYILKEIKDKNVGSAGGTVQLWTGVQKIENCGPPRQVMDPPLQLEADEKVEEKEEEKSREQCRGVSGNGEEALTCPLCAQ